jgi:hypothetical protein
VRIFGWVSPKEHTDFITAVRTYQRGIRDTEYNGLMEIIQERDLEIANLRSDNLALRNQIDTSGGGEKRRSPEANKGKVKS